MKARPVLTWGPAAAEKPLLEGLLAELGLSGALVTGHDAHGRPTLCLDGQALAFSRSRTGDCCLALALAREGRLGVDLVKPFCGDPGPLEALFHPSERAWLGGLRTEVRHLALSRCWAAKEAMLKALGLGLGFGLDAVELVPDAGSLRVARIAGGPAGDWNLELSCVEGLVLALAWAE